MGGTVIIIATLVGYFASHLFSSGSGPSATGLLLLYLFTGMGVVGFLDDFIKVRKQRSLGLSATAKLIGQLTIGISFAVLALRFKDSSGLTRRRCTCRTSGTSRRSASARSCSSPSLPGDQRYVQRGQPDRRAGRAVRRAPPRWSSARTPRSPSTSSATRARPFARAAATRPGIRWTPR
jgi:hypothetical protein